jgi:hypothetical protein
MMLSLAVLSTALLFGGMTLYAFGFAAFLFTALPAKTAGEVLRRAFPCLIEATWNWAGQLHVRGRPLSVALL